MPIKYTNSFSGDDVSKLKKQCSSDNSPWKCLQEDRGDVAFVSSKYIYEDKKHYKQQNIKFLKRAFSSFGANSICTLGLLFKSIFRDSLTY